MLHTTTTTTTTMTPSSSWAKALLVIALVVGYVDCFVPHATMAVNRQYMNSKIIHADRDSNTVLFAIRRNDNDNNNNNRRLGNGRKRFSGIFANLFHRRRDVENDAYMEETKAELSSKVNKELASKVNKLFGLQDSTEAYDLLTSEVYDSSTSPELVEEHSSLLWKYIRNHYEELPIEVSDMENVKNTNDNIIINSHESSSSYPQSSHQKIIALLNTKLDELSEQDKIAAHTWLRGCDVVTEYEELFWRYIRSHYDMSELEQDEVKKERYLRNGVTLSDFGMMRFPDNEQIPKWNAFLLRKLAKYQSAKEKIQNLSKIYDNLILAKQNLPNDASVYQALGEWCYDIAGISGDEQKAAQVLLGTPPKSTYEEALEYFQTAFQFHRTKEVALRIADIFNKLRRPKESLEWTMKAEALGVH